MIEWAISLVLTAASWVWTASLEFARRRPLAVVIALIALARMFGTTVQTGWAGVLFSFGRARKVLEPGFHPLIPIFQRVRHTPIRSITLDLPRQRVTTADGLVYDVLTTIVYRVEDAIKALTEIDEVRQGVATLVPLLVHDLMREQSHDDLADRQTLDGELTARARGALARWGVAVEQVGLSTIAPTPPTVRVTQLTARARERAGVLRDLTGRGLDRAVAAVLSAPGPAPLGRSTARYRARRHPARQGRAPGRITVVLPEGGVLHVNDVLTPASARTAFETPKLEPGRRYAYVLRARQFWFGRSAPQTVRVDIAAGQALVVDFTGPAPTVSPEPSPPPGRPAPAPPPGGGHTLSARR